MMSIKLRVSPTPRGSFTKYKMKTYSILEFSEIYRHLNLFSTPVPCPSVLPKKNYIACLETRRLE